MRRKLQKIRCPKCSHVEPIMDLINTANCFKCGAFVEPVENGYVIIETDSFEVIEISKD